MTMLFRALAVLSAALLAEGWRSSWTFAPSTSKVCADYTTSLACHSYHRGSSHVCVWHHSKCINTFVYNVAIAEEARDTGSKIGYVILILIILSIIGCIAACICCCCWRQEKQVVVVQQQPGQQQQQQQEPVPQYPPQQYPPQQSIPVVMGEAPQQGVAIEMEDEPACNPTPCQPSCQTRV